MKHIVLFLIFITTTTAACADRPEISSDTVQALGAEVPPGDRIDLPPDPQVDLTIGWSTSHEALTALEWEDLRYQFGYWREYTLGTVAIMYRVCNNVRLGKPVSVTQQELYAVRRRMFWWRGAYPRSADSVERCFNRMADRSTT